LIFVSEHKYLAALQKKDWVFVLLNNYVYLYGILLPRTFFGLSDFVTEWRGVASLIKFTRVWETETTAFSFQVSALFYSLDQSVSLSVVTGIHEAFTAGGDTATGDNSFVTRE